MWVVVKGSGGGWCRVVRKECGVWVLFGLVGDGVY